MKIILGLIMIILYLGLIAFIIASMWKVFTKADKPGWAAIVPIYNTIILLEIAGKPWWWIFLLFIPIVNIVFMIIVFNQISLAFGKTSGFTVGLIFLGFIFFPILAWGKATYTKPLAPTT